MSGGNSHEEGLDDLVQEAKEFMDASSASFSSTSKKTTVKKTRTERVVVESHHHSSRENIMTSSMEARRAASELMLDTKKAPELSFTKTQSHHDIQLSSAEHQMKEAAAREQQSLELTPVPEAPVQSDEKTEIVAAVTANGERIIQGLSGLVFEPLAEPPTTNLNGPVEIVAAVTAPGEKIIQGLAGVGQVSEKESGGEADILPAAEPAGSPVRHVGLPRQHEVVAETEPTITPEARQCESDCQLIVSGITPNGEKIVQGFVEESHQKHPTLPRQHETKEEEEFVEARETLTSSIESASATESAANAIVVAVTADGSPILAGIVAAAAPEVTHKHSPDAVLEEPAPPPPKSEPLIPAPHETEKLEQEPPPTAEAEIPAEPVIVPKVIPPLEFTPPPPDVNAAGKLVLPPPDPEPQATTKLNEAASAVPPPKPPHQPAPDVAPVELQPLGTPTLQQAAPPQAAPAPSMPIPAAPQPESDAEKAEAVRRLEEATREFSAAMASLSSESQQSRQASSMTSHRSQQQSVSSHQTHHHHHSSHSHQQQQQSLQQHHSSQRSAQSSHTSSGLTVGQPSHIQMGFTQVAAQQLIAQGGGDERPVILSQAVGYAPLVLGVFKGEIVCGGFSGTPEQSDGGLTPDAARPFLLGRDPLTEVQEELERLRLVPEGAELGGMSRLLEGLGGVSGMEMSSQRHRQTRAVHYETTSGSLPADFPLDQEGALRVQEALLRSIQETTGALGRLTQPILATRMQAAAGGSKTPPSTPQGADKLTTDQEKESVEEGFIDADGNIIVSKKVTRVVTTTKTVYDDGDGEPEVEVQRTVEERELDPPASSPGRRPDSTPSAHDTDISQSEARDASYASPDLSDRVPTASYTREIILEKHPPPGIGSPSALTPDDLGLGFPTEASQEISPVEELYPQTTGLSSASAALAQPSGPAVGISPTEEEEEEKPQESVRSRIQAFEQIVVAGGTAAAGGAAAAFASAGSAVGGAAATGAAATAGVVLAPAAAVVGGAALAYGAYQRYTQQPEEPQPQLEQQESSQGEVSEFHQPPKPAPRGSIPRTQTETHETTTVVEKRWMSSRAGEEEGNVPIDDTASLEPPSPAEASAAIAQALADQHSKDDISNLNISDTCLPASETTTTTTVTKTFRDDYLEEEGYADKPHDYPESAAAPDHESAESEKRMAEEEPVVVSETTTTTTVTKTFRDDDLEEEGYADKSHDYPESAAEPDQESAESEKRMAEEEPVVVSETTTTTTVTKTFRDDDLEEEGYADKSHDYPESAAEPYHESAESEKRMAEEEPVVVSETTTTTTVTKTFRDDDLEEEGYADKSHDYPESAVEPAQESAESEKRMDEDEPVVVSETTTTTTVTKTFRDDDLEEEGYADKSHDYPESAVEPAQESAESEKRMDEDEPVVVSETTTTTTVTKTFRDDDLEEEGYADKSHDYPESAVEPAQESAESEKRMDEDEPVVVSETTTTTTVTKTFRDDDLEEVGYADKSHDYPESAAEPAHESAESEKQMDEDEPVVVSESTTTTTVTKTFRDDDLEEEGYADKSHDYPESAAEPAQESAESEKRMDEDEPVVLSETTTTTTVTKTFRDDDLEEVGYADKSHDYPESAAEPAHESAESEKQMDEDEPVVVSETTTTTIVTKTLRDDDLKEEGYADKSYDYPESAAEPAHESAESEKQMDEDEPVVVSETTTTTTVTKTFRDDDLEEEGYADKSHDYPESAAEPVHESAESEKQMDEDEPVVVSETTTTTTVTKTLRDDDLKEEGYADKSYDYPESAAEPAHESAESEKQMDKDEPVVVSETTTTTTVTKTFRDDDLEEEGYADKSHDYPESAAEPAHESAESEKQMFEDEPMVVSETTTTTTVTKTFQDDDLEEEGYADKSQDYPVSAAEQADESAESEKRMDEDEPVVVSETTTTTTVTKTFRDDDLEEEGYADKSHDYPESAAEPAHESAESEKLMDEDKPVVVSETTTTTRVTKTIPDDDLEKEDIEVSPTDSESHSFGDKAKEMAKKVGMGAAIGVGAVTLGPAALLAAGAAKAYSTLKEKTGGDADTHTQMAINAPEIEEVEPMSRATQGISDYSPETYDESRTRMSPEEDDKPNVVSETTTTTTVTRTFQDDELEEENFEEKSHDYPASTGAGEPVHEDKPEAEPAVVSETTTTTTVTRTFQDDELDEENFEDKSLDYPASTGADEPADEDKPDAEPAVVSETTTTTTVTRTFQDDELDEEHVEDKSHDYPASSGAGEPVHEDKPEAEPAVTSETTTTTTLTRTFQDDELDEEHFEDKSHDYPASTGAGEPVHEDKPEAEPAVVSETTTTTTVTRTFQDDELDEENFEDKSLDYTASTGAGEPVDEDKPDAEPAVVSETTTTTTVSRTFQDDELDEEHFEDKSHDYPASSGAGEPVHEDKPEAEPAVTSETTTTTIVTRTFQDHELDEEKLEDKSHDYPASAGVDEPADEDKPEAEPAVVSETTTTTTVSRTFQDDELDEEHFEDKSHDYPASSGAGEPVHEDMPEAQPAVTSETTTTTIVTRTFQDHELDEEKFEDKSHDYPASAGVDEPADEDKPEAEPAVVSETTTTTTVSRTFQDDELDEVHFEDKSHDYPASTGAGEPVHEDKPEAEPAVVSETTTTTTVTRTFQDDELDEENFEDKSLDYPASTGAGEPVHEDKPEAEPAVASETTTTTIVTRTFQDDELDEENFEDKSLDYPSSTGADEPADEDKPEAEPAVASETTTTTIVTRTFQDDELDEENFEDKSHDYPASTGADEPSDEDKLEAEPAVVSETTTTTTVTRTFQDDELDEENLKDIVIVSEAMTTTTNSRSFRGTSDEVVEQGDVQPPAYGEPPPPYTPHDETELPPYPAGSPAEEVEETSPGFGDRARGFAKRVGIGAAVAVGAVTVGPAALVAVGAKKAYDSFKSKDERGDGGEASDQYTMESTTTTTVTRRSELPEMNRPESLDVRGSTDDDDDEVGKVIQGQVPDDADTEEEEVDLKIDHGGDLDESPQLATSQSIDIIKPSESEEQLAVHSTTYDSDNLDAQAFEDRSTDYPEVPTFLEKMASTIKEAFSQEDEDSNSSQGLRLKADKEEDSALDSSRTPEEQVASDIADAAMKLEDSPEQSATFEVPAAVVEELNDVRHVQSTMIHSESIDIIKPSESDDFLEQRDSEEESGLTHAAAKTDEEEDQSYSVRQSELEKDLIKPTESDDMLPENMSVHEEAEPGKPEQSSTVMDLHSTITDIQKSVTTTLEYEEMEGGSSAEPTTPEITITQPTAPPMTMSDEEEDVLVVKTTEILSQEETDENDIHEESVHPRSDDFPEQAEGSHATEAEIEHAKVTALPQDTDLDEHEYKDMSGDYPVTQLESIESRDSAEQVADSPEPVKRRLSAEMLDTQFVATQEEEELSGERSVDMGFDQPASTVVATEEKSLSESLVQETEEPTQFAERFSSEDDLHQKNVTDELEDEPAMATVEVAESEPLPHPDSADIDSQWQQTKESFEREESKEFSEPTTTILSQEKRESDPLLGGDELSDEADGGDPTSPSFGQRMKSMAKKAGLGAAVAVGAVTVGPAALLAVGAHKAYTSIKDKSIHDADDDETESGDETEGLLSRHDEHRASIEQEPITTASDVSFDHTMSPPRIPSPPQAVTELKEESEQHQLQVDASDKELPLEPTEPAEIMPRVPLVIDRFVSQERELIKPSDSDDDEIPAAKGRLSPAEDKDISPGTFVSEVLAAVGGEPQRPDELAEAPKTVESQEVSPTSFVDQVITRAAGSLDEEDADDTLQLATQDTSVQPWDTTIQEEKIDIASPVPNLPQVTEVQVKEKDDDASPLSPMEEREPGIAGAAETDDETLVQSESHGAISGAESDATTYHTAQDGGKGTSTEYETAVTSQDEYDTAKSQHDSEYTTASGDDEYGTPGSRLSQASIDTIGGELSDQETLTGTVRASDDESFFEKTQMGQLSFDKTAEKDEPTPTQSEVPSVKGSQESVASTGVRLEKQSSLTKSQTLFESPVQSDRHFTASQDNEDEDEEFTHEERPPSEEDNLDEIAEVSESSKPTSPDDTSFALPEIKEEQEQSRGPSSQAGEAGDEDEGDDVELPVRGTPEEKEEEEEDDASMLAAPEDDDGRPMSPMPPRSAEEQRHKEEDEQALVRSAMTPPVTISLKPPETESLSFAPEPAAKEGSPETDNSTTKSSEHLAESEVTPDDHDLGDDIGAIGQEDLPTDSPSINKEMISSEVTITDESATVDASSTQGSPEDESSGQFGDKAKDIAKKAGIGAAAAVGAVTIGPAALLAYGAKKAFDSVSERFGKDGEEADLGSPVVETEAERRAMEARAEEPHPYGSLESALAAEGPESAPVSGRDADTEQLQRQLSSDSIGRLSAKSPGSPEKRLSTESLDRVSVKSGESSKSSSGGGKRYSTSRRSSASSRRSSHDESPTFKEKITPELQITSGTPPPPSSGDRSPVEDAADEDSPSTELKAAADAIAEEVLAQSVIQAEESPEGDIDFSGSSLHIEGEAEHQISPSTEDAYASQSPGSPYDVDYPGDYPSEEGGIDMELSTVPEEPEDEAEEGAPTSGPMVASTEGSDDSPASTLLKHKRAVKYDSTSNISEGSLQEFERLEHELAMRGEGSLSSSEADLLISSSRRKGSDGSLNSLNEFEKLEKEVDEGGNGGNGNGNGNGGPVPDVMLLSDIHEESEPEDMSIRGDDDDEDSIMQLSGGMGLDEALRQPTGEPLFEIPDRQPTPTQLDAEAGFTTTTRHISHIISSEKREDSGFDSSALKTPAVSTSEDVPHVSDTDSIEDGFEHVEKAVVLQDAAEEEARGAGLAAESTMLTSTDSLEFERQAEIMARSFGGDSLDAAEGVMTTSATADKDSLQDFEVVERPEPSIDESTVEIEISSVSPADRDSLEDLSKVRGAEDSDLVIVSNEEAEEAAAAASHFSEGQTLDHDSVIASSISGNSSQDIESGQNSQDTHGLLSGDTVGTYQEYGHGDEGDRDSLTEELGALMEPRTPVSDQPLDTQGNLSRHIAEAAAKSGSVFGSAATLTGGNGAHGAEGSTGFHDSLTDIRGESGGMSLGGGGLASEPLSAHFDMPTTLTTFTTSKQEDDGSLEIITRTVTTAITDPVSHHVRFTGTDSEAKVEEYIRHIREQQEQDVEEHETVDEQGNVTKTVIRRVRQTPSQGSPASSIQLGEGLLRGGSFESGRGLGSVGIDETPSDPLSSPGGEAGRQQSLATGHLLSAGGTPGVAQFGQSPSASGGSMDSLESGSAGASSSHAAPAQAPPPFATDDA